MELTVSRPVKILVLVLVIAGVAGIASLSMLGKSSGAPAQELSVAQIRARAHSRTETPKTAAKPAVKPAAKPAAAKPKPVPAKPRPVVAESGLPTLLDDAFRTHAVVVVSIFDPQSKTDAFSYSEARAGAADARVGFVAVSVLNETLAGPLTTALPGGGLLPVPGLLIYRAPGDLVQRIDGFADRDAVAQLAIAARTAEPVSAAAPAAPAPATTP